MKFLKKITAILIVFMMIYPSLVFADTNYETYYFNSDISLFDNTSIIPPDENEVDLIEYIVSEIEHRTEIINVESYNITKQRFIELMNYLFSKLQLEHPDIFYIVPKYSFNSSGNTVIHLKLEYYDDNYISYAQSEIENELNNITSLVSDDMSDFEKILVVHDYIVNNYSYDTTYESRTLDTMVLQKTGVCQGYTYLFKYVMDNIGIDCVTVPSDENNHIWNKVKVDGEWYNIDLTSDDPLYGDLYTPFSNQITRTFFLLNDSELKSIKDDTLHTIWNEYKWDGQTPAEVSDSTVYSDSVARQLQGPIVYHNDEYYGFANIDEQNGNNNLVCADFSENTLTSVYKDSSSFKWKEWGTDNIYYPNTFSTLVSMNGNLYFNSPNEIYMFDTINNTVNKVYEYTPETPDKSQTYIWGLSVIDDIINIEYSENVNKGVQIYIPVTNISKPNPIPTPDENDILCDATINVSENNDVKVTFIIPEEVTNVKYLYTAQYDINGILIGITQTEAGLNECTVTPDEETAYIRALIMSESFEPLGNTDPYILK